VSCGASVRRWRDGLDADYTSIVRIAIDSNGCPVVRATFSDACEVCGASEIKIRVAGVG
jgi:hypothetical protein